MDQTLNVCQIVKRAKGFAFNVVKNFLGFVDLRLITCPVKKGKYVGFRARKSSFLNDHNLIDNLPNLIRMEGEVLLNHWSWTIKDKKRVSLMNGTCLYVFE
jgi:hypothetical protein